MKKYIKILIILNGLIIFTFAGCEKEVLNKEPKQFFSELDLWSDLGMIEAYTADLYNVLGDWRYTLRGGAAGSYASATNDAYIRYNYNIWVMNEGSISADNMGGWGPRWGQLYGDIRSINIFFDQIDKVEGDQELLNFLKGEMHFLRARAYADLVKHFGGVPLITEPFELDDDFMIDRNSYREIVDFVISELDNAASLLPNTRPSGTLGRATRPAALAQKSRMLLYAASKLHDPSTEPSGSLFDYDKVNKWQEAADAAKAVIDLGMFSLPEVDTWKDYQLMFMSVNSETIFTKPYSSQYPDWFLDLPNSPNGYGGWATNSPTQNLVDAFQTADGKYINDPESGYDPSPSTIYNNRELRFYANIVHQGSEFRGRPVEFYLPGGMDSADGPLGHGCTHTGYTVRKFQDESIDFTSEYSIRPWVYFRLSEIYLNYAEAQYHLGNEDIAREYINKIRKRVHLPDINTSGNELIRDIMHERRMELYFENHYFFDIRRWMIAEETQGDVNAIGFDWMIEDGEVYYNTHTVQTTTWHDRMYYIPIPRSEIDRTGLVQNPGY